MANLVHATTSRGERQLARHAMKLGAWSLFYSNENSGGSGSSISRNTGQTPGAISRRVNFPRAHFKLTRWPTRCDFHVGRGVDTAPAKRSG